MLHMPPSRHRLGNEWWWARILSAMLGRIDFGATCVRLLSSASGTCVAVANSHVSTNRSFVSHLLLVSRVGLCRDSDVGDEGPTSFQMLESCAILSVLYGTGGTL